MKHYLLILQMLIFFTCANAQRTLKEIGHKNPELSFLENKGQLCNEYGQTATNLLFKTQANGADVYITTSGISYVFIQPTKESNSSKLPLSDTRTVKGTYCRSDMELIGARIAKENIIKEGESTDYSNYYLSQCPEGVLKVHSYQKIVIKNIYPGIDWILYTAHNNNMEYDFIVHPGADPSLIKLKYRWANKPTIQSNGELQVSNPLGVIHEGAPIAYTQNTHKNTSVSYQITGNDTVSFLLEPYDHEKTLIIDPTLIWATYYGGSLEEDAYSMSLDSNNLWICGSVLSVNFPTYNPGGSAYFQGSLANNNTRDACILKFNKKDVLKWATYYGGSKEERAYAISSNGTNVWVTGYTKSPDFPILNPGNGAYFQDSLKGKSNAFILKFDTAGKREWATYYGGSGNDIAHSISADKNTVWLTGITNSANFPVTNPGGGAYFQNNLAGKNNSFIAAFNNQDICQWSTYYGDNNADSIYSICSDGNSIWLTGTSSSTNLTTVNPGNGAYYQNKLAGIQNAFILKFSPQYKLQWGTYYGGNGTDCGYSINSDGKNIWITGRTTSTNLSLVNPGGGAYFQPQNNGMNDLLLLKFTIAGQCKWATYYGGVFNDYGYAINSDGQHVFVTGNVGTQDCYPNIVPWFYLLDPGHGAFFENGTYNGVDAGGTNAYILEFNKSGICHWATFYGTLGVEQGNALQSDGINMWYTGTFYTAGTLPALDPGGGAYYQDTVRSQGVHQFFDGIFMGEVSACLTPEISILPDSASICIGDTIPLIANQGNSYLWSPASGLNTTSGDSIYANPSNTTTYTVNYVAGKCMGTDTLTVHVVPKPVPIIKPEQSVCMGNSIQLNVSGGISYLWNPANTLNNSTISNPVASPTVTTTYTVTLKNQACSIQDSEQVIVNSIPPITACCNSTIDEGQNVNLNVNPVLTGASYNWTPADGLSCDNCPNPVAFPDVNTIYIVKVTDSAGCYNTDTVVIDINCSSLFIPDAFSPNGDGKNDYLYVRGDCIKTMMLSIFDRWGNKVFETTDQNTPWDGNYKGKPLNTGTYTYTFSATLYDGNTIHKKGNISLIR